MASTDGSIIPSLAQNKGEHESSKFMDAEQDYKVITKWLVSEASDCKLEFISPAHYLNHQGKAIFLPGKVHSDT